MKQKMLKKLTSKQQTLLPVLLLMLAVLALGVFFKTRQHPAAVVNPSRRDKAQSSTSSSQPAKTSSTGTPGGQTATSSQANSALAAPQGQASHTIVSKSAADQAENSPRVEVTCLTGAANDCVVRLTSPSNDVIVVKNNYSDHQGNFIFEFNAKNYQLGKWQMELVATKDGQEAVTNIGPLEVTP